MRSNQFQDHFISKVRSQQIIRGLANGIEASCRFLRWGGRFTIEWIGEGLVPGTSSRIVLHREAFEPLWPERVWIADLVPVDALRAWNRARAANQTGPTAIGRLQNYRVITEAVLPAQLSVNLQRCFRAIWQPSCPHAANAFMDALPPHGAVITAGILLRRMGSHGVGADEAWTHILGAICSGLLLTDLRLPLESGSLLRRRRHDWEPARSRTPDGSPGQPLRRTSPPWSVCAGWHEIGYR